MKKSPSGRITTLVPIKQETIHMGSSLNWSSSWLENRFLNEVIFMPQHQYVRGLLNSAQKTFWMVNQFPSRDTSEYNSEGFPRPR